HFFDENRVAQREAEALAQGDMDAFLQWEIRSGRSSFMRLQNVFACSNPSEQGLSVALAVSEKLLSGKKASWRVHGGGFAGTVQAFVPLEELDRYKTEMEKVFGEGTCHVLSVRSAGGTRVDF
ncbi:MAG: galactokinase, partial [Candidatus Heritagella sp.]